MRKIITAIALVFLAGTSIFSGVPAHAVDGPIEVSLDGGDSWTSSPLEPVFSESLTLVPGDTLSSEIRIRNARHEPGTLRVFAVDCRFSGTTIGKNLTLSATDSEGLGLAQTSLRALDSSTEIVPERLLNPGDAVEVTLTLDFDASVNHNLDQGQRISFNLLIVLSQEVEHQVEIPGFPGSQADTIQSAHPPLTDLRDDSRLAVTGRELLPLLLAVALIGLGVTLHSLHRGRRRACDE